MQHRQTFLRFHNGARFKRHPASTRKEALEGIAYVFTAYYTLAVNYQNRAGLIQSDESFHIAEVEGMLEESMDFGWAVCGRLVCVCRNAILKDFNKPRGRTQNPNRCQASLPRRRYADHAIGTGGRIRSKGLELVLAFLHELLARPSCTARSLDQFDAAVFGAAVFGGVCGQGRVEATAE